MRINSKYILNNIAGQNVVLPIGESSVNFGAIINLNETATFLWEKCSEMEEINLDLLANALVDEYEINAEMAMSSVIKFVEQIKAAGCIDE